MSELTILKLFLIIPTVLFLLSIIGLVITFKKNKIEIRYKLTFSLISSLMSSIPAILSYNYMKQYGEDIKSTLMILGFFALMGCPMLISGYAGILNENKNDLYLKETERQDKWE